MKFNDKISSFLLALSLFCVAISCEICALKPSRIPVKKNSVSKRNVISYSEGEGSECTGGCSTSCNGCNHNDVVDDTPPVLQVAVSESPDKNTRVLVTDAGVIFLDRGAENFVPQDVIDLDLAGFYFRTFSDNTTFIVHCSDNDKIRQKKVVLYIAQITIKSGKKKL